MKYMILKNHRFLSKKTGKRSWFGWVAYQDMFMGIIGWGRPEDAKRFDSEGSARAFMARHRMRDSAFEKYKLQKCH